jgi:hypothetical protein
LTGERPEPTFLISKPFRHEMVKAVISQALFFDQKASVSVQIERNSGWAFHFASIIGSHIGAFWRKNNRDKGSVAVESERIPWGK